MLGEENKNKVINILKELGYDGFFDYEIEKKIYDKLKYRSCCPFSILQINSPAVAVFDKEKSLNLINTLKGKDLQNFKEFELMKKSEKKNIFSIIDMFNENTANEQIFLFLRNRIYTLTDNELREIIKMANTAENRKKQKEEFSKIMEDFEQRFAERC